MGAIGGILSYPPEQLYGEVACLAAEFHWSLAEILNLEHGDRRRWVEEVAQIRRSHL